MCTDGDSGFEPLPDGASGRQPVTGGHEVRAGEPPPSAPISIGESHEAPGQPPHWAAGSLFGAIVGLAMGAVAGAACCWLSGAFELFWDGVLIGGVLGSLVGAIIGRRERTRGRLVRPDSATRICVLFGAIPSLLICLQCAGLAGGAFSVGLFLGLVWAAPMLGLLVGGVLDRSFEACLNRSWRRALVLGLAGLAACLGLIWTLDALACGPDPEDVARKARAIIITKWRNGPDGEDAKIHEITLKRTGRLTYAGTAEATRAGLRERLRVEAWLDNELVWVRRTPLD